MADLDDPSTVRVGPRGVELHPVDRPLEFGPLGAAAGLHRERASFRAAVANSHRCALPGDEVALAQIRAVGQVDVVRNGVDDELPFSFDRGRGRSAVSSSRRRERVDASGRQFGSETPGESPVGRHSGAERGGALRVDDHPRRKRGSSQFALLLTCDTAGVGDDVGRAERSGSASSEATRTARS